MKPIAFRQLPILAFTGLVLACSAAAAPARFVELVLVNPRAVALDPAGNLFVGDVGAAKVYRITPAGTVSVHGPAIPDPIGITVGRDGAVFVADADANTIYRIAPDGSNSLFGKPSTAPGDKNLAAPTSIVLDASGNAYITNNGSNSILKLTAAGVVSIVAGKPGEGGNLDGVGAAARFALPRGIAIDATGNLYVADERNSNIRKITPAGIVTTLAGAGSAGSADGLGAAARFGAPRALTVDAAGNVYVADTDNHVIRKITPGGVVTTFAGRAGERGKADGAATVARFSEPRAIAVGALGTLYVADTGNGAIRQITPDGLVTTLVAAAKP